MRIICNSINLEFHGGILAVSARVTLVAAPPILDLPAPAEHSIRAVTRTRDVPCSGPQESAGCSNQGGLRITRDRVPALGPGPVGSEAGPAFVNSAMSGLTWRAVQRRLCRYSYLGSYQSEGRARCDTQAVIDREGVEAHHARTRDYPSDALAGEACSCA